MKTIFTVSEAAKGTNTKKVRKATKLSKFNKAYLNEVLSLGAICRHIDNAIKHQDESLPLKPNALEACTNNGTFKTVLTQLTEKEKVKNRFTPYTVSCILNRLDKKK